MPTKTVTVTSLETRTTGATRGKPWTLYAVAAQDEEGVTITDELITFDELPVGRPIEVDMERRERTWRDRMLVSYVLRLREALPGPSVVPAGTYTVGDTEFLVWRSTRNPEFVKVYAIRDGQKDQIAWPRQVEVLSILAR